MGSKEVIKNGEGENYDYLQDHCYVKLPSKKTNGELCLVEDFLKPGFYLARHHHKIMTEVFYMLEGELEMIFDDETVILKVGDTLTIPPNIWHEVKCKNGGKMLTLFKNGQFDVFLRRLSEMPDQDLANKDLMKSLSEEFDIYE